MVGLFPEFPPAQGEEHWCAKMNETQVLHARKLYWQRDMCIRCISIIMETPYTSTWEAVKGRTWKHLPMPENLRRRGTGLQRRPR